MYYDYDNEIYTILEYLRNWYICVKNILYHKLYGDEIWWKAIFFLNLCILRY